MTFVIVAKPAPCTCGITRFFLGFCYTLCYAAIVTKTNRIARIFNQRRLKPCQKPKYTSPKSQLVITAFLVSVEGEDDIFDDYIIYLGILFLTNFISPQNQQKYKLFYLHLFDKYAKTFILSMMRLLMIASGKNFHISKCADLKFL